MLGMRGVRPKTPISSGTEALPPGRAAAGVADAMIKAQNDLDHGVGHRVSFGLACCASRRTEESRRYLV
jgi:hypothetical protein